MSADVLFRGAEATVTEQVFYGHPAVKKERIAKTYRHPTIDTNIRQKRLHMEARALAKAQKLNVRVPAVYWVDPKTCSLWMEKVSGHMLAD
eukprot:gene11807-10216_t